MAWASTMLGGLGPGDRVALHWDWICDGFDDDRAALIESHERRQLSFE